MSENVWFSDVLGGYKMEHWAKMGHRVRVTLSLWVNTCSKSTLKTLGQRLLRRLYN